MNCIQFYERIFRKILVIIKTFPDLNFDLYLEQHYFPKNIEENKINFNKYSYSNNIFLTVLDLIMYVFKNCMSFDKSTCEYSNLRLHFADFRTYYFTDKLFD